MQLKNYTTGIDAVQTIGEIEQLLVSFGASDIHRSYKDGKTVALIFELPVEWGSMAVSIPADVDAAHKALRSQFKKSPTPMQAQRLKQQAERVAWRIWLDWLKVQLSLLTMQKVQPAQVFMAYAMANREQTVFQAYCETHVKGLLAAKNDSPATIPMTGTED